MKRTYRHCTTCHKRMRIFSQEENSTFYLCPCGNRVTFHRELNAISDDWPVAAFNDAVSYGIIKGDGTVHFWCFVARLLNIYPANSG